MLPPDLAVNITAAVSANQDPIGSATSLPQCQELPSITFILGHNFTISAFEYSLEVAKPHEDTICLVAVMDQSESGLSQNWNRIVLESPNRPVGCE
jgi:hypothetical protein